MQVKPDLDALQRYVRYRNDPWLFMIECVYTKDQVDLKNPIKKFPDKEYLRFVTRIWQKYPLMAFPKTRRMTMSWLMMGLYVHDTIFHKGRFNAFVSKKEDDANELVQRAKFIIDNLDKENFPKEFIPPYQDKFCVLNFPTLDSKIQGFPQGADQLRQFTFSGILGDECAFWEGAQKFYAASLPTIDGGGRMSLVSSPAPGFFKKLVFDALDIPGHDINVGEYNPAFQTPIQGVRVWRNQKNRFMILELHYTADPSKRHPDYKESIKNSMPLQEYLREYELHWDTFEGHPVYPEFSKLHITYEKPEPILGLPMLVGFDFGLTPAAIVAQLQGETLVVFKEYVELNMGIDRFADIVIPELRLRFPAWSNLRKDWKCFIDPSGAFKRDTDENTCALILQAKGFNTTPGPIAWEARRGAVVHWLRQMTKEGPAMQIHAPECSMLVKGFEGGYRFPEKAVDIEPTKIRPLKDAYSHPHDAFQYLCSGIKDLKLTALRQIPKPAYSMTGAQNGR